MPTAPAIAPDESPPAPIAERVDAHLTMLLSAEREHWVGIEPRLAEPFDLLADFLLEGGKRLRPTFCMWGFLGAGGHEDDPTVVHAAAALELMHAFALLHDDVMDGSTTRRRRPALHVRMIQDHREGNWGGEARRFGEGVAVLIGDLAFAWAERLIASLPAQAQGVWHDLTVELMMGQYLDVTGAARHDIGLDQALHIARTKSGAYTVERPLHLGAALAGRLADLGEWYSAFGRPVGEAFQLRDDLLGVFGDGRTGKPVGDDLREGKPTALLALARRLSDAAAQPLLDRVGCPDLSEHEIARLRRLFVTCGARQEVEDMIGARHATALAVLAGTPVPDPVRAALAGLAGHCLWRTD